MAAINYSLVAKTAAANGITGLVGIGIYLLLQSQGVPVTPDQVTIVVGLVMARVTAFIVNHHIISQKLTNIGDKIDSLVKTTAGDLPTINYAGSDFPAGKNGSAGGQ
jgi:hypothetical protein